MRNTFSLNQNWKFSIQDKPAVTVDVPHTWNAIDGQDGGNDYYRGIGTYEKIFQKPTFDEKTQDVYLEFCGVNATATVTLGGQQVAYHDGGYSTFRVKVTPYLQDENMLQVAVDNTVNTRVYPQKADFTFYGGIYRDVNLLVTDAAYIEDVMFRYDLNGTTAELYPEIRLNNAGEAFDGDVTVTIRDAEGTPVKQYAARVPFGAGFSNPELARVSAENLTLWDTEHPYLYTVDVELRRGTHIEDTVTLKTGFRTVLAAPDGFYLNGEKLKLVGLDRHQSYPYAGYALPERVQAADADVLRNYLHVNTVRTSHYLQSEGFLSRCDEVGLLVFSEIPGWGYIGGEKFKETSHQDIRDMITTQYNHPSIFIWSIRINESADDDEFYLKSNEIAHSLDKSRPTTGVRCIKNSHLLEDVYAFNDFIHMTREVKHYRELVLTNQQSVTGLTHRVPYIVTEYSGHVYPVKPFDGEERQLRQAQIHARVQNANMERNDAMGAIGWCAFDYQTHGDYGSGDKICYHGVMDIFRMPKYAAYVYRSQVDPAK